MNDIMKVFSQVNNHDFLKEVETLSTTQLEKNLFMVKKLKTLYLS